MKTPCTDYVKIITWQIGKHIRNVRLFMVIFPVRLSKKNAEDEVIVTKMRETSPKISSRPRFTTIRRQLLWSYGVLIILILAMVGAFSSMFLDYYSKVDELLSMNAATATITRYRPQIPRAENIPRQRYLSGPPFRETLPSLKLSVKKRV